MTVKGKVTNSKGVAYVDNGAGSYLFASGADGTDLYNLKNYTIVAKLALVDATTPRGNVSAFIAKENAFAYGISANTGTGAPAITYIKKGESNNAVSGEKIIAQDEFRIFAITFEFDTTTNTVVVKEYMSNKEVPTSGLDFELMVEQTQQYGDPAECLQSTANFILGKRYDHTEKNRNLKCYFDDVKIYSKVLTTEEMKADCPQANNYTIGTDDAVATTAATTVAATTVAATTTKAATTKAETTKAGTTVAATTVAATTGTEEKGGCGSSIGIGAIAIAALACGAVASKKKRR